MKLIYLAGPITKGNPSFNVQDAVYAADRIIRRGYAVFVPQLSVLWEMVSPWRRSHDEWMALDLAILARCDALVRLPGDSVGADKEVAEAARLGLTVFLGLESFLERAHDVL